MSPICFEATIIRPEGTGTWCYVDIPVDLVALTGVKGRINVKGAINEQTYANVALPHGDGRHYLVVNRALREAAGAGPGSSVSVELEVDTAPRAVEIPDDVRDALAAEPAASDAFTRMASSHQKHYLQWIAEAKTAPTRERRIRGAIERVLAGQRLKG
ncbi:MAG TPA: YdeI/OmpD-associated family protein [Ktedonobacterales bacterium]